MNTNLAEQSCSLPLQQIIESPNVALLLDQPHLDRIGSDAVLAFRSDLQTRAEWEQRMSKAMKLALQVAEIKTFPWENCSNVKFPLLTIAALQFLARVSVMTKGRVLAKVEPVGADPDGRKAAQAKRISTHLSLQLTDEDRDWHDQDETMKLAASIMGSAFKKTYYDGVAGIVDSEYVPAGDLVMDYFTRDVAKANRITQILTMSGNDIQERVRRGLFCEMTSEGPGDPQPTLLDQEADQASGIRRPVQPTSDHYVILEQHTWLDLDGDGYQEPYIVSVRQDTKQVLRIVARFNDNGDVHRVNDAAIRMLDQQLEKLREPKQQNPAQALYDAKMRSRLEKEMDRLDRDPANSIIRIDAQCYYTRYLFIPSPDGGVYGLGMGALLGPMNESVNSLVNQLIDGGTMANTAGGFLGHGVKIKGGSTSFNPFEWKPIDSTGDDLRKNIFPLPVREPSSVLFQLLGMLVTYSEKISGSTDIMTGISPGQNTPAETSRNTVEQGMMLFSGIYNRMYRGFREELSKFAALNRIYLPSSPRFADLTSGSSAILAPDDYDTNLFRIFPAASAEAVSQSQQKQKMMELIQLSATIPGFNRYRIVRDYLEIAGYDDIESIYPDPQGPKAIPAPQNPKVELEKAKLQQQAKVHQDEMQLEAASLQNDVSLNAAKIQELEAKAMMHLASAQGVGDGNRIALINAQIGAAKARQEGLVKALALVQKSLESKASQGAQGNDSGNGQRSTGMGLPSGDAGAAPGSAQLAS